MKMPTMVNGNDLESVVAGTQKELIESMQAVLKAIRLETPSVTGMSFDQIEYFLAKFGEKKLQIFFQDGEM